MLFPKDAWDTETLASEDKRCIWHPFTQMKDWCDSRHEPLILTGGEGATLRDSRGREYIDGNSSIWTNIHGHRHPAITAAIKAQLDAVAHVSFLGATNAPAIRLASRLVGLMPAGTLTRVFYSDDGSTAIEAALKMAVQYWQIEGRPKKARFAAFEGAYHGDTAGAASLGGIPTFHGRFSEMHFPVDRAARVDDLQRIDPNVTAAIVIEPLIQGAAGMRLWEPGMLRALRAWCDNNDVFLVLDEIMTGFGRTGTMFAFEREAAVPDILALAKGLTGGYLPLAATLTTERIFEKFLGRTDQQRTLYYGHSYTGNPLGCAAALASLDLFETEKTLERLKGKIELMQSLLEPLSRHPHVKEVRQIGFIAGIELGMAPRSNESYPWTQLVGARVCAAARRHGLLTRPILDTIVLMPPLCTTDNQLLMAVSALRAAIHEICGGE